MEIIRNRTLYLLFSVLSQLQFIPHPAAVIGCLSLTGGAEQFVVLQMFQSLDDPLASLFAVGVLPWRLVAERRNRFIQNPAVLLVQVCWIISALISGLMSSADSGRLVSCR